MKLSTKIYKAFCLTILIAAFGTLAEAKINNEHQVIIDTAYDYFNGAANGDQEQLARAFDMEFGDVKMITVDKETGNETIRSVPLKQFATYFKKATEDVWQAKVLSVDVVGEQMAMVKLDFDTPKTHYVDYLVMYKRQQKWKIINKTFVATRK